MQWISGVPEDHARFYSLVIADTVAYMHHKHVIFRDLKPENILIDKDGYPNIIDFGFAKVVHHKTFTFCGTPQYVAPEIILSQGHSAGVDHWVRCRRDISRMQSSTMCLCWLNFYFCNFF